MGLLTILLVISIYQGFRLFVYWAVQNNEKARLEPHRKMKEGLEVFPALKHIETRTMAIIMPVSFLRSRVYLMRGV